MDNEKPSYLIAVRQENQRINTLISEARKFGQTERLAGLCDEYLQFLWDTRETALGVADNIEQLSSKYPQCKSAILELAQSNRDFGKKVFKLYSSIERYQREGKLPTLLPSLPGL